MSDALLFIGLFGGLFVLRIIVATIVFFLVIPEGDRCPHCDSPTLRMQRPRLNRILPFVRASWCYECDWEGWLRRGPVTAPASPSARLAARSPSP